jgi:spermidine synthase
MTASGNRRAPVVAPVTFGTAEIRPDSRRPAGWTVLVDGVDQSYVDLADPRYLAYPYIRRLAGVLDVVAPAGVPIRVLHLGGGGLTLPRYVAATRPRSPQVVVERDPALVALVGRILPLPAAAAVEVRVGDARAAVDTATGDGYDVVVADVFAAARMPDSVAGAGFAAAVARLLRPHGLLGMNLTDLPPLAWSRAQTATLRSAFGDVALLAEAGMLRGRRAGNVVLVAGHGDLPVGRLAAAAARDAEPGRVLHGPTLDAFVVGARPRRDTPG